MYHIKSLDGMAILFYLGIDRSILAFYVIKGYEEKKECVTLEKCKQCFSICKLFAQFVYTLKHLHDV